MAKPKVKPDAQVNPDIYKLGLRMAASIVDSFELKTQSAGFNIGNWRAQLAGNQGLNFACEVKALINGEKFQTSLPVGYILAGTKGASGALWNSYKFSKMDDIPEFDTECLNCIGFLFEQLLNGKPFAVVNQGRGRIIQKLLEILNPEILLVTIIGIPVDDKGTKVNYQYDLTDVQNFSNAYSHRARLIDGLDDSHGRDTKPLDNKKTIKKQIWKD